MQQLGRQAINFLEGTTEGLSPRHRIGASDELSFDHCFYIYGGRQSFEELEALGNECARLCNRLRTKLAPEGKARLDAALASLGPLFDLQVPSFSTISLWLLQGFGADADFRIAAIWEKTSATATVSSSRSPGQPFYAHAVRVC